MQVVPQRLGVALDPPDRQTQPSVARGRQHQPPPRHEHAPDLRQPPCRVGDMLDHLAGPDDVERPVVERQRPVDRKSARTSAPDAARGPAGVPPRPHRRRRHSRIHRPRPPAAQSARRRRSRDRAPEHQEGRSPARTPPEARDHAAPDPRATAPTAPRSNRARAVNVAGIEPVEPTRPVPHGREHGCLSGDIGPARARLALSYGRPQRTGDTRWRARVKLGGVR